MADKFNWMKHKNFVVGVSENFNYNIVWIENNKELLIMDFFIAKLFVKTVIYL